VSAFVGLSVPIGITLGAIIVGRDAKTPQLAYVTLAGLLFVFVFLFAFVMRDERLPKGEMPPLKLRTFLANFWLNPARYPDFGWAWLTRFLFVMSYACATSYLLYFLQDAVHYEQIFHGQSAARGVSTFQLILTALLLVSSIGSGILSDRTQRRKLFVTTAGIIMALALLLLAFFPSWLFVELAAAVFGLGYGIYVAVDLALVIQVLPSARNRGKDMGVINIAGTLPQVIAPALIGVVIGTTHSYLLLFSLAAIFSLLAASLIPRIKSVK
jgi:MFS family permease